MSRVCALLLLPNNNVDMVQVGYVQWMLWRLFCWNSGVDLPSQDMMPDGRIINEMTSSSSCSSDGIMTYYKTQGSSNKMDQQQILCVDVKCLSPVSVVVARRYSRLDHM